MRISSKINDNKKTVLNILFKISFRSVAVAWLSWLKRLPSKQEIASSNLVVTSIGDSSCFFNEKYRNEILESTFHNPR